MQKFLPQGMCFARALPGVKPAVGDGFRVDEANSGPLTPRRAQLAAQRRDVLAYLEAAQASAGDVYDMLSSAVVCCPAGRALAQRDGTPLMRIFAPVEASRDSMARGTRFYGDTSNLYAPRSGWVLVAMYLHMPARDTVGIT